MQGGQTISALENLMWHKKQQGHMNACVPRNLVRWWPPGLHPQRSKTSSLIFFFFFYFFIFACGAIHVTKISCTFSTFAVKILTFQIQYR